MWHSAFFWKNAYSLGENAYLAYFLMLGLVKLKWKINKICILPGKYAFLGVCAALIKMHLTWSKILEYAFFGRPGFWPKYAFSLGKMHILGFGEHPGKCIFPKK